MLRRAENVHTSYKRGFLSKKGVVTLWVGKKPAVTWSKVAEETYRGWLQNSAAYPVQFGSTNGRNYWLFQNRWHWDNDGLDADQIYALLVTRAERQQATINRAQMMVAGDSRPVATARRVIPPELRQFVMQRDRRSCRKCGSGSELQLDHIIPVALGGGTSAENLEVLCGPCNRRKGTNVGF